jgi:hypothetical protein
VYNFDGIQGNNFQVFRQQQSPNFIVPQTTYNPDGTQSMRGCPVAGDTNAQCWAQYGLAIDGQAAPANATTAGCPTDSNGNSLVVGNDTNGNPLPALCAPISPTQ